jgi:hypothetical protein
VVDPRGLSEPLSVAEKLATFVAGLVVTAGVGVGVGAGVGVGVGFTTVTVPTILQHAPCGVQ